MQIHVHNTHSFASHATNGAFAHTVKEAIEHLSEDAKLGQLDMRASDNLAENVAVMEIGLVDDEQGLVFKALPSGKVIALYDANGNVHSDDALPPSIRQHFLAMIDAVSHGHRAVMMKDAGLVRTAFNQLWEKAEKVPFEASWANGTGYFDRAVGINYAKPRAFEDVHGRHGILIPGEDGQKSSVVFERYAPSSTMTAPPLVYNASGADVSSASGLVSDCPIIGNRILLAAKRS